MTEVQQLQTERLWGDFKAREADIKAEVDGIIANLNAASRQDSIVHESSKSSTLLGITAELAACLTLQQEARMHLMHTFVLTIMTPFQVGTQSMVRRVRSVCTNLRWIMLSSFASLHRMKRMLDSSICSSPSTASHPILRCGLSDEPSVTSFNDRGLIAICHLVHCSHLITRFPLLPSLNISCLPFQIE